MNRQQTSLNGYITNWSLMAIISFTWLCIYSAPLPSVTGIPALQEELYVQMMTSLAFANIIATMSILVHIYIRRNLAFLHTPVIIWSVETLLNLECLVILFAVVSGFAGRFQSQTDIVETGPPDDRSHQAISLLIAGIGVTNSFIMLSKMLFADRIYRLSRMRLKGLDQDPVHTEQWRALPLVPDATSFTNDITRNNKGTINGLAAPATMDRYSAEGPGLFYENNEMGKWKFSYHDELIFYFGYCICFPQYFQDYTGSPYQDIRVIELPP